MSQPTVSVVFLEASGGLQRLAIGLYARTPGLRRERSVSPTQRPRVREGHLARRHRYLAPGRRRARGVADHQQQPVGAAPRLILFSNCTTVRYGRIMHDFMMLNPLIMMLNPLSAAIAVLQ